MTLDQWLTHCTILASGPTVAGLDVHFPTKWLIKSLWRDKFGDLCADCDRHMRFRGKQRCSTTATVDHIVCRALGGSDEPKNKRVICHECNGAKSLIEWQVARSIERQRYGILNSTEGIHM